MLSTSGARILRAEDAYRPKRMNARTAALPLAEWAFHRYPPVLPEKLDLSRRGRMVRGLKIKAEVNHGRWVGRCTFCSSAQVVSPSDPRFLCAGADGCANAEARGAFVRIVFPPAAECAAIEAALVCRPRENRNWTHGETAANLRKENRAHGLDNV